MYLELFSMELTDCHGDSTLNEDLILNHISGVTVLEFRTLDGQNDL